MTSEANVRLPPHEFVEHVRSALEHLYDFPYLQSHPLAQAGLFGDQRPGEMDGQRLRRYLIEATETLNPGQSVAFLSPHARLYNLLRMHYVDGMTIQKAAHELGISMRQASRNLRQAEESVAAVLWSSRRTTISADLSANSALAEGSVSQAGLAETERLALHLHPIDICKLVDHACHEVQELAQQRQVVVNAAIPPAPVIVWADPVAAPQVLISLVSKATQHVRPGILFVELTSNNRRASLALRYMVSPGTEMEGSHTVQFDPVVTLLATQLDWNLAQSDQPDKFHTITLQMPSHGSTLLVIDDNAGLARLVERYLTGLPCQVVAAPNGITGVDMASQLAPDAILLDVMMPELDGWEILRTLRNTSRTASIPVVICSVLNNPDLASSLGATAYLVKPIRRDDVLSTLHRLSVI